MEDISYEDLIDSQVIIDWSKDWEFIFKYAKPIFDMYNPEWFYRWIGENASGYDCCAVIDKLIDNINIIQRHLHYGKRICPKCGLILARRLKSHLITENLSPTEWHKLVYKENPPICALDGCDKISKFNYHSYFYQDFCSLEHEILYMNNLPRTQKQTEACRNNMRKAQVIGSKIASSLPRSQKQLEAALKGLRKCWSLPRTEAQLEACRNNMMKARKVASELGIFQEQGRYLGSLPRTQKQLETARYNGLHYGKYNLINMSKIGRLGWHSYPEDLLGDILFKININYIREYRVMYGLYRIDYYLPDFNVGLECDGMYKWDWIDDRYVLKDYWNNRKHDIQSNTGIIIKNIPSNYIFYYNYNKRELYNLIIQNDYPLILTKSE